MVIKIFACLRVIKILEHVSLDDALISLISKLRIIPFHTLVESVTALSILLNIRNIVTATSCTLSPVFVNYVNDGLPLLEVISSVSEYNIEMVSEAERALLPQFFTFCHPNYIRYMVCFLGSLSYMEHMSVERPCWKKCFWKQLKRITFHGIKLLRILQIWQKFTKFWLIK